MNKTELARKLFWFRVSASKMTGKVQSAKLRAFLKEIRPMKTDIELIRIGGDTDGGYLIPNDLEGISACFSPGVSDVASFEMDLQKRGIPSYLADYSVDGPPAGFNPAKFTKKFIGPQNTDTTMTLDHWVSDCVPDSDNDLLLQMDIEGDEYRSLPATNATTLKRFRIILLEIHRLDRLYNPAFFRLFKRTMEKLMVDFTIVHNHPNNCCGSVSISGVEVPRVLELTFLRKDRIKEATPALEFPHKLDWDNVPDKAPLVLPEVWYK